MKKWGVFICCLVVMALMTITASSIFAAGGSAVEKDFCWRDSYGRGVGTVPQACAPDRDRIGLLCYTKCPAGMKRVGFDCHSVCPDGMRDDGLFCRLAEYGRGAGYPWKAKDGVIHPNDGMRERCEKDHGKGNCEKNGAIYYPKCKPNYHNVGCCICRPDDKPNCEKLGLKKGIDLSCAKKIIIGDPRVGVCPADKERNAGLCYKRCKAGFDGVGPVCWGLPPPTWVKCGMGAAKDKKTCAETIFNQVSTVLQAAANIVLEVATLGTDTAAVEAENTAKGAAKLAELKKELEELKKLYDAAKDAIDPIVKAKQAAGTAVEAGNLSTDKIVTPEDIARIAAQIAAIVDPTGIADVAAAYLYPKCEKYFPTK